MGFRILTLNSISVRGLERLPRDRYEVASEIGHPDAVLLRSADMHAIAVPDSVLAVARAGAGTNNIPVSALTKRGIPVFNAPGANANAVKELVIAGLRSGTAPTTFVPCTPATPFIEAMASDGVRTHDS